MKIYPLLSGLRAAMTRFRSRRWEALAVQPSHAIGSSGGKMKILIVGLQTGLKAQSDYAMLAEHMSSVFGLRVAVLISEYRPDVFAGVGDIQIVGDLANFRRVVGQRAIDGYRAALVCGRIGSGHVGVLRKAGLAVVSFSGETSGATTSSGLHDAESSHAHRRSFGLLQALVPGLKSVSVVIPNYNYSHFLEARLNSIISQTYPVFEIIVLDDASTDDSRDVLGRFGRKSGRTIKVVANDRNSGSVFRQWSKGVAMAQGDLVWIAEADDMADTRFLERLAAEHADPALAMAFANSRQVDEHSTTLAESYDFYYGVHVPSLIPGVKLPGLEFLRRFLSVRNVVFNVSSVLFRKAALDQAIAASIADFAVFRVAGDWHVYIAICAQGGLISYVPESLNVHRRHAASVTLSEDYWRHLGEIIVTHGKVAKILDDETPVSSQTAYIAELAKQLALQPSPGNSVSATALRRWQDTLPADPQVRARAMEMIPPIFSAALRD